MLEPVSKIKEDLGINPNGRVQKAFTSMCRRYMAPFVLGGENGELQKLAVLGNDYIDYISPYAHYQYEGILYIDSDTGSSYAKKGHKKIPTSTKLKPHTPNTGSHWDKRMMSVRGKELMKELQGYVDRGAK